MSCNGSAIGAPLERHWSAIWSAIWSALGAPWERLGGAMGAPRERQGSAMGARFERNGCAIMSVLSQEVAARGALTEARHRAAVRACASNAFKRNVQYSILLVVDR